MSQKRDGAAAVYRFSSERRLSLIFEGFDVDSAAAEAANDKELDLLPFMSRLKLSLKCDTKGLSCQTVSEK